MTPLLRFPSACEPLRLPTTAANVHPSLGLRLYGLYLLVDQFHQWCVCRILPEDLVADFQQQLVDIQLDRTGTYTPLHDFRREVVCAVQRYQHSFVDLFVNSFETIKVDLPFRGASGPVVAVHVANGGRKDVDTDSDEVVDVFRRCEKCWLT